MAWDDDAEWLPTTPQGVPLSHYKVPQPPRLKRSSPLTKSESPIVRTLARWLIDCPEEMPTNQAAHAGLCIGLLIADMMSPGELLDLIEGIHGRGVVPDETVDGILHDGREIARHFLNGD